MKKGIYFVMLFVLSLGLNVSCNSDDDSGSESSIVGKWQLYQDGEVVNGTEVLELWLHECATEKDYVEFTGSGNLISHYFEENCTENIETGTYTVNGNQIKTTFVYDGTTYETTANIETLNSTTLKIKETYVDNGVTYTDISVLKRM